MSIRADSLSKSFGTTQSLDGASFHVESGEIFGYLGSNGAGKSTTMLILSTLLKPTSGRATVAGYDIQENPSRVRERIGFVQQESTIDEYLSGRENLMLQARLNHMSTADTSGRIDDILVMAGLEDRQYDAAVTYSGGMKRRLDIACGLLHHPGVLFLDEPTVGLDIQTRRRIWEQIRQIRDEYNMTVFLSTHYMEEADELCDRICIIDHGSIKAIGEPERMKEDVGFDVISIRVQGDVNLLAGQIRDMANVESVSVDDDDIIIDTRHGDIITPKLFELAARSDIRIQSISMGRATLDDVYMSYTGRQIQETE